MNFLVCSKVSIPAKDRTLPAWEYLRSRGHTVTVEHPLSKSIADKPDVIISMGVSIMEETFEALKRFPGVPLYAYNWDIYAWIWEQGQEGKVQAKHASRPREYDYVRYGELLKQAREVWVPSRCTGLRTEQWYGLKNWSVILSACPWWDWKHVSDEGYALCCLREIPDPYWGRLERVCGELGIPLHMPKHELTYEAYLAEVARCRFLVSDLYELSTGGLSLLEGYYHGKPVLLSDSPWHGGRDYFGDRALYFKHDDESHLKTQLMRLWRYQETSAQLGLGSFAPPDHKEWIETNFSDQRMVDDMLRRIAATT